MDTERDAKLPDSAGNHEEARSERARRLQALSALAQGAQSATAGDVAQATPGAAPALSQMVAATPTGRRVSRWRADGRVVAVDVAATDPNKDPSAVQLYDCQTGKLLGTLKPSGKGAPTADQVHENDMSVLRWSPDGSHLLLFDRTLGTLTVWGPEMLPAR